MFKKLEGLLPALVTSFDEQGNVNTRAAENLIKYYVAEGADGLYSLGWTGEGWCMTVFERKQWAEAVLDAAKGKLPVVIHVGYNQDNDDSEDLAKHAAGCGAYAVSSVPLPGNNSMRDNVEYFKKLYDAAGIPFYIYWNQEIVDDRTGKRANPKDFLDLMSQNPGFAGIKYTDSNFYYLERLKKYNPDLNILTGVDGMCIAGGLFGADGSIGALQAVTCKHMKTMWLKFKAGETEAAVKLQIQANNVYEMFERPDVGVIQGIKAIMAHRGVMGGYPKPPVKPITDKKILEELIKVYNDNIL